MKSRFVFAALGVMAVVFVMRTNTASAGHLPQTACGPTYGAGYGYRAGYGGNSCYTPRPRCGCQPGYRCNTCNPCRANYGGYVGVGVGVVPVYPRVPRPGCGVCNTGRGYYGAGYPPYEAPYNNCNRGGVGYGKSINVVTPNFQLGLYR